MALNWATAVCDCRIPAFGLPRVYSSTTTSTSTTVWNSSPHQSNTTNNPSVPLLVGRLHPGPHLGAVGACFSIWTLVHHNNHNTNNMTHNLPLQSLHAFGHYLTQASSSSSSSSRQHGSIVVTQARHSFTWTKQQPNNNNDNSCIEWRQRGRRRRLSQGETTNAWNEAALTRLEQSWVAT
eukprot:scaffold87038_cov48-Attheya_sp.AAC.1